MYYIKTYLKLPIYILKINIFIHKTLQKKKKKFYII